MGLEFLTASQAKIVRTTLYGECFTHNFVDIQIPATRTTPGAFGAR